MKEMKERFVETYDKYADAIFRFCLFKLGERELALDVMQEAFTKTWDYMREGKEVQNIRAFVYKTSDNLIKDYWKKKKALTESDLDGLFDNLADENSHGAEGEAEHKLFLRAIKKLEPDFREILILRYVDGLEIKEISEILDISQNNTSVRINRALTKVREFLNIEND